MISGSRHHPPARLMVDADERVYLWGLLRLLPVKRKNT